MPAMIISSAAEVAWINFVRVHSPIWSALAVARTHQRLADVSIYKALGGGREICAQADQDCGGADGIAHLGFMK